MYTNKYTAVRSSTNQEHAYSIVHHSPSSGFECVTPILCKLICFRVILDCGPADLGRFMFQDRYDRSLLISRYSTGRRSLINIYCVGAIASFTILLDVDGSLLQDQI